MLKVKRTFSSAKTTKVINTSARPFELSNHNQFVPLPDTNHFIFSLFVQCPFVEACIAFARRLTGLLNRTLPLLLRRTSLLLALAVTSRPVQLPTPPMSMLPPWRRLARTTRAFLLRPRCSTAPARRGHRPADLRPIPA